MSPAQDVCTRNRMEKSKLGGDLGKPPYLGGCYRFAMSRAKCPQTQPSPECTATLRQPRTTRSEALSTQRSCTAKVTDVTGAGR